MPWRADSGPTHVGPARALVVQALAPAGEKFRRPGTPLRSIHGLLHGAGYALAEAAHLLCDPDTRYPDRGGDPETSTFEIEIMPYAHGQLARDGELADFRRCAVGLFIDIAEQRVAAGVDRLTAALWEGVVGPDARQVPRCERRRKGGSCPAASALVPANLSKPKSGGGHEIPPLWKRIAYLDGRTTAAKPSLAALDAYYRCEMLCRDPGGFVLEAGRRFGEHVPPPAAARAELDAWLNGRVAPPPHAAARVAGGAADEVVSDVACIVFCYMQTNDWKHAARGGRRGELPARLTYTVEWALSLLALQALTRLFMEVETDCPGLDVRESPLR